MEKSKIILYDLEISKSIVAGYGTRWDYKPIKLIRPQELMCYSYKELGSKKVQFVSRHDFKNYHDFVKSLHSLLDSAAITIAHNGNKFDNKKSNTFFITQGLTPPRPRKSIDTLLEARRWFNFESNSLDDLANSLGVGRKEKISYADLEDDFMSDSPKASTVRAMKRYNNKDVTLLEDVYLKMRPFMASHPNLGDITQSNGICPKCGGNRLHKRGFMRRRAGMVQRYQCMTCGGWCSEASIKREGRIVNGV